MPYWQSAPLRILLGALGTVASACPRGLELAAGPLLGRLVLALGLFKAKTAAENIRRCFPELEESERRKILRGNYEHYGILFFEFLHFFSPIPGHYRRYMKRHSLLEGYENWERAHAKGKGVLFVASHVGYWEMLAAAGALSGMPLTVVTTVLQPDWLNAKITAERSSTGVEAAYHPGAGKHVLKALRNGRSVAFMNDQYAPPPMGLPVKFFGVKVNTLSAVAPLAKRTGAAIIPVGTYRDDKGVSRVVIGKEMHLGADLDDTAKATEILAGTVERWVRRHPTQWLWIHRRFKNVDWNEPSPKSS
jgi:KDO2-lipid IV(A) lauroyltransferase